MSARLASLLTSLLVATATLPAHAGRSCQPKPPTPAAIAQGMALAERTAARLDAGNARVVMLARAGQDLSAYGLSWSHVGFAYRTEPGAPWRVVHKLNQCGTARASLHRQGLGQFFLDDPWRYDAAIVVLAPPVQEHLLALLADNARVDQLNTPSYSMVAYPWAVRYQQSNQWALETLALAEEGAADSRERAQAWLRFKGYQPTTLRIGALQRLGARMTTANVAFDDHPNDKRYSDRIETVTADSVLEWLARAGLGGRVEQVRLP